MLEEIIKRLKILDPPVAEGYFCKPPPSVPYIVWFCAGQKGRGADCMNNIRERRAVIELYTDKRAVGERKELEKELEEKVLFDLEYERVSTDIEAEELTQTAYEFVVIEKGGRSNGR